MEHMPPISVTNEHDYQSNPPSYYYSLPENPQRKQLNQVGFKVCQAVTVCTHGCPLFTASGSVFRVKTLRELDDLASVLLKRPILINATVKYDNGKREPVIVTVNPNSPVIKDQINNAFIQGRELMDIDKTFSIDISFKDALLQYYARQGDAPRKIEVKPLTLASCSEEARLDMCCTFVFGVGLIAVIIMAIIALFYLFFFLGWLIYKLQRNLSISWKHHEISAPVTYVSYVKGATGPATMATGVAPNPSHTLVSFPNPTPAARIGSALPAPGQSARDVVVTIK